MELEYKHVKMAVVSIVGFCTSATVSAAIKNNVGAEKTHQKMMRWIGASAVGGIVAGAAKAQTSDQLDGLRDLWNEAQKKKTEQK